MGVEQTVDAMLDRAEGLLGAGSPPEPAQPVAPTPVGQWPAWQGDASDRAETVSRQLDSDRQQLHSAQSAVARIVTDAASTTTEARIQLAGVRSEWEQDKAALRPIANQPEGQAALTQAGQTRLTEANAVIQDAAARMSTAAGQVQAATGTLPGNGQAEPLSTGTGEGEGGEPKKGDPTIQFVNNETGLPPEITGDGPPPSDRAAGTGQWVVDTTKAYAPGQKPGPPEDIDRELNIPEKLATGPTTGLLSTAPPFIEDANSGDLQRGYKYRVTGAESSGITKMVEIDGQWYQAQWLDYKYEQQVTKVLQGTGDFGGITTYPIISDWEPVTMAEIRNTSALYPTDVFYLPDTCGGTLKMTDTVIASSGPPPTPIMRSGG